MALANVNVCGPKTARVCAKSMKMDVGAKVGRPGAMSRVVRVRASAEKIDFNDEGAFTLPYAPVREALLPDGPWTVIDGGVCGKGVQSCRI